MIGDRLHRSLQLLPAVAPQGAEGVAGEALRMHPHQWLMLVTQTALGHEQDVFGAG